jgi:hypothetical protein
LTPGIHQACPVCGNPDEDLDLCAVCQWQLRDDPVLGEPTRADAERAEAALGAAGHAWDTRAAALSEGGRERAGGQLAEVLRGGGSGPGGIPPEYPALGPGALPAADPAEWRKAVSDLAGGRIKELVFVEFTPECVSVIKAYLDSAGLPRQADAGTTEWRYVAPEVDARREILRFQLAGGIGTLRPVDRREFETAVGKWLRAYIPRSYAGSLVLVVRRSGWLLLDRAAAVLRRAFPPLAEIGPAEGRTAEDAAAPADVVAELLRTVPLAADHTLLLARVDRGTGAVTTHAHVLFPAGTRLGRGRSATAEVTVHGGAGGPGAPLLLPLLTGGPEPAVLSVPRRAVPELAPARLTFTLRGPGEVALLDDGQPAPAAGPAPALRELLAGLPRRIVRPPALDVYFTVDLSGADAAEARERLDFVREVTGALAARQGARLRIGLVGHYDHRVRENAYNPKTVLLQPVKAGTPAAALAALGGWQPALREQDTVSSLEDALAAVGRLAGARPPAGAAVDRVLVVVGRRPPAPHQQHGAVPSCPLGADWRTEIAHLRARGLRVLARADPEPGQGPVGHYAAESWSALGADGSFRPRAHTAADVADALTPSWRSDGPPCRLAFAAPLL